ncbi:hypothetical protein BDA99DRAFT_535106 [Phascolomyces articulosus]|uniref:Uncharacterized protein n=1 Tax=Phascolomyces articulosus TaxID=60185 RepID=A0AAD5PGD2_9FUNG|nr:hypothetical protein BDA99DRAFT_535106 [Phascolomyces articulosus]
MQGTTSPSSRRNRTKFVSYDIITSANIKEKDNLSSKQKTPIDDQEDDGEDLGDVVVASISLTYGDVQETKGLLSACLFYVAFYNDLIIEKLLNYYMLLIKNILRFNNKKNVGVYDTSYILNLNKSLFFENEHIIEDVGRIGKCSNIMLQRATWNWYHKTVVTYPFLSRYID